MPLEVGMPVAQALISLPAVLLFRTGWKDGGNWSDRAIGSRTRGTVHAVQYVLILPLNFILVKDDMLALLSDTGHCSFPEGSEQRSCRKWFESRWHFDRINVPSGTKIQC